MSAVDDAREALLNMPVPMCPTRPEVANWSVLELRPKLDAFEAAIRAESAGTLDVERRMGLLTQDFGARIDASIGGEVGARVMRMLYWAIDSSAAEYARLSSSDTGETR